MTFCRGQLQQLYNADQSLLSFEGQQMQGAAKIMEKLGSLTFQKIQHLITTTDCQPMFDGGILINVLGQLKVKPLNESWIFLIISAYIRLMMTLLSGSFNVSSSSHRASPGS